MAIFLPQRWRRRPDQDLQVDWANPDTRNLYAFFDLRPGRWALDIVSGRTGGSIVGAGATFNEAGLVTSGNTTDYVDLSMGNTGDQVLAPLTIIVGCRHISGSVDWSMLTRTSGIWNGYYQGGSTIIVTNNNDFAGDCTTVPAFTDPMGITYYAMALRGNNDMRGVSGGGTLVTDTSCTAYPGGAALHKCALGLSLQSVAGNAAVAWIQYFGVFAGRALGDHELRERGMYPWVLFKKRQRVIYSFPAMGAPQTNPAFLLNLM